VSCVSHRGRDAGGPSIVDGALALLGLSPGSCSTASATQHRRSNGKLERHLRKQTNWRENRDRLTALGHLGYVSAHQDTTSRPASRGQVLDPDSVRSMRQRFRGGEPLVLLAAEFGISVEACRNALRGKTWAKVEGALGDLRQKFTPDQQQAIAAEYLDGANFTVLAARCGCSPTTILEVLYRTSVEQRPVGPRSVCISRAQVHGAS